MKENTAAVHTQVPVDVATFLLNEKRADIQAIELRHKITILLLPNKNLETPAHDIQRLRHDELNQDDMREPSYKMVDQSLAELPTYATEQQKNQNRPTAAIRNIAPAQPAPISMESTTPPERVPEEKTGFITKLFSWLSGDNKKKPPVEVARPRSPREPREGRGNGRRQAGDSESRQPRGERAPRGEGRQARGERGDRTQRGEAQEGRRNSRNERAATPAEGATAEEAVQNNGGNNRRRGGRDRRPSIPNEATTNPSENPTLVTAEGAAPTEATGEGSNGNSRRRGRRGGRRERGDRPQHNADGQIDNVVEQNHAALAVAAPAPVASVAMEMTPVAAPEIREAAPVVVPSVESTPVASAPVEVATSVVTPAPAFEAPPVIEPAPVPTPMPAPVVPTPVSLEAVGLQMVETNPEKRASVASTPTEKPVRKPRAPRAKPVVVEEPLQMVETRKD